MSKEKQLHPVNGWLMLLIVIGIWVGLGYMVYSMASEGVANKNLDVSGFQVGLMVGLFILEMLVMPGFFAHWLDYQKLWGGQKKMPRCRSDRLIADEFSALACFTAD